MYSQITDRTSTAEIRKKYIENVLKYKPQTVSFNIDIYSFRKEYSTEIIWLGNNKSAWKWKTPAPSTMTKNCDWVGNITKTPVRRMPLEAYQSEQFSTTGLLISLLVQKYSMAPGP